LINLRNHGNSLIVVEHDEDTISAADHLIDLGPGAGRLGGEVVYQGAPPQISGFKCEVSSKSKSKSATSSLEAENLKLETSSPTLRAFRQLVVHPIRGSRRPVPKNHPMLHLTGCTVNNLNQLDVRIPLARLTVLTGISGSGKSSLMHGCLAEVFHGHSKAAAPFKSVTGGEHIKACYEVDQSPIGKTSRSCPATYVKVFDHIRALFA
jgi:excinuclease ABC subunit A